MIPGHRLRFLKEYFGDPTTVGAIAPSSRGLAAALCDPFRRRTRPARVLEVGAGTGAVTRYLGSLLGEQDELDICEIQPEFVRIIECEILSHSDFAPRVGGSRIRLLEQPVQEINQPNRYDFIISGLPLTAFELQDVQDVFAAFRRCLQPDGVLSYFEYIGLRKISWSCSVGRNRERIRSVSSFLSGQIRDHQFDRQTVLMNLPPAHARHFRFNGPGRGH